MKITILGCGNAFSVKHYNQTFLVEENGRRMLIDYGWQAPHALRNAGLTVNDIDDVYISHAHADHIGGLEQMAFLRYDWKNHPQNFRDGMNFPKNKPTGKNFNYAPRIIANDQLLKDLWEKSLRGGLESMEGFVADLSTYFEPVPIKPNSVYNWEGWNCELIQQIHIMSGSMISWTFGLIMSRKDRKTVYFVTDSQHCSPRQMEVFYAKSDLIIQDCECTPFMSGVHANYGQLSGDPVYNSIKLPDAIKKKMWLSHYQDFVSENKDFSGKPCDWQARAKGDGFQGFVKIGQTFEL
ncbi:MAG: MBL fold metallo-hydrolase [Spirochaetota bacterium]